MENILMYVAVGWAWLFLGAVVLFISSLKSPVESTIEVIVTLILGPVLAFMMVAALPFILIQVVTEEKDG